MNELSTYSRSDFFKSASVIAGTVALTGSGAQAAEKTQISSGPEMRKMGKTDLQLPVISLGTSPAQDVNVMKFAIAQGVNFIHTSIGYKGGKAIENVAKAIEGQRDKVILGLKITWQPDDDEAMDAALETLGVDHVDIAFFNIHKASQVSDSKFRLGAERWKKAGKFNYIGLTSHKETFDCLNAALDEGFYDVIMPSYALSMEQEFLPLFQRAQKEGVGVVLMKTGRGLNGAYEDSVPHYLATAGITTICKGASSFPEIKGLIDASKEPADTQAGLRLRETSQLAMSGHCLMCGACEENCPQGLQVADVVRCSDYYLENPELVATAYETYRELSRIPSPAICGSCNLCEHACRNGVPVVHHIRRAKNILA